MKSILFFVLSMHVFICSIEAQTPNLALDFSGEQTNGFNNELSLGWSFAVSQPVQIEALAFFDHFVADDDGLNFDHLVRVWTDDAEPQLIVASVITNASSSIPTVATNGRWLVNNVAPVFLLPGNYVIGADDPPCSGIACDRYRLVAAEFTIPQITFGEARSASPPGPPQSPQPQLDGGYFGPSFVATPVIVGDVNGDKMVDLLDIAPFLDAITRGNYVIEADLNFDGVVDLLDVAPFVELLSGG